MTTATITTTGGTTALAIRAEQTFWDERQIAALGQLGLSRAPKGDLAVFFHQSKRTGLDPFARQLYMIERKGRFTIQTSIDGFRVIADRACAVRGWVRSEEPTVWIDQAGLAHTEWLSKSAPVAARYTCIILTPSGQARFSAVARFDEYHAGGPMWTKMPATMVAKCAEALALRKAFPQDLSGLYTADEMAQATSSPQPSTPAFVQTAQPAIETRTADAPVDIVDADIVDAVVVDDDPFAADDWNQSTPVEEASDADYFGSGHSSGGSDGITEGQSKMIYRLRKKLDLTDETFTARMQKAFGITSDRELTKQQASKVISTLKAEAGEGEDDAR
jgi:phage recombination protein Bet